MYQYDKNACASAVCMVEYAQQITLYQKYKALADSYDNLHLLGRLAEYKYYNMDAIVAQALALTDKLV